MAVHRKPDGCRTGSVLTFQYLCRSQCLLIRDWRASRKVLFSGTGLKPFGTNSQINQQFQLLQEITWKKYQTRRNTKARGMKRSFLLIRKAHLQVVIKCITFRLQTAGSHPAGIGFLHAVQTKGHLYSAVDRFSSWFRFSAVAAAPHQLGN